jgi:hypothetical protein
MDKQTRIGLGGCALFTLAGIGAPYFGWAISGPIMVVCAIVALWGFLPLMTNSSVRVHILSDLKFYLPFWTAPIQDAARYAYSVTEEKPFGKYVFNWDIDDDSRISLLITHLYLEAPLYGRRPPSNRFRPLETKDFEHLTWVRGTNDFKEIWSPHRVTEVDPGFGTG